ncbi:MAG: hypothetical protein ABJN21_04010 [Paracoccaceae bacterium]
MMYATPIVLATTAAAQEECATIADCAQKAVEAANQAKLALRVGTPKGAVLAFNLDSCPDGWVEFTPARGRTIIGAGQGDGLRNRELGQQGGAETHTLTAAQIPAHTHSYQSSYGPNMLDNTKNINGGVDRYEQMKEQTSGSVGGGKAHNIMQPFYTLMYCERG